MKPTKPFVWLAPYRGLGCFDEDGLVVFVDRKKDMIKTGIVKADSFAKRSFRLYIASSFNSSAAPGIK